MITVENATDPGEWDAFLRAGRFSPFLQSWTMGEVHRAIGQEPIRLQMREGSEILAICQAIVIPARRGKHVAIPYGPLVKDERVGIDPLIATLKDSAIARGCAFARLSPFWPQHSLLAAAYETIAGSVPSPLHLLAEHIWYLPLTEHDAWISQGSLSTGGTGARKSEEELLMAMRKTTRNLIRRAEKEGVTVSASPEPLHDLPAFLTLHEETRRRHGFTPYTNAFFRAQVEHFAPRGECTLYLARYQGEVVAASIHMHVGGETSYHHGASTHRFSKIPASYLLQWTAIRDALRRGDHTYSFWGIAPEGVKKHPFAGVTLFKQGFGGTLLPLVHCRDLPLSPMYAFTRGIETLRKWRRGF